MRLWYGMPVSPDMDLNYAIACSSSRIAAGFSSSDAYGFIREAMKPCLCSISIQRGASSVRCQALLERLLSHRVDALALRLSDDREAFVELGRDP